VYKPLVINSYKGEYQALFSPSKPVFYSEDIESTHYIIDQRVAEYYKDTLKPIIQNRNASVLIVEATEANKSLEIFPAYVEHLVKHRVRRDHKLIAVGGGIIQDITCFLAATMLRGLKWWFYPTTLLAQADSCIGSKSSINCGNIKNILGTFTPPEKIFIFPYFIDTLDHVDVHSGFGEMLKVHAIKGPEAFNRIAGSAESIFLNPDKMLEYLRYSLEIKKDIIERDEFDHNIRRVMNYGHTFGHAIETATNYQIPHGIAVTLGMDMANFFAAEAGDGSRDYFLRNHAHLKKNSIHFLNYTIPFESFMSSILKDKKNRGRNQIGMVLPDKKGVITPVYYENNDKFKRICADYFENGRFM